MAHERKRLLKDSILKVAGFSSLIGVVGHRQVGKTTLLTQVCEQYTTFDQYQALDRAISAPDEFLTEIKGNLSGIDECQLAEPLFPALKEWVRKHKKPGQFILSGSTRFTALEKVKESLTGRIITLELFPFSIEEIIESKPVFSVIDGLEAKTFEGFINRKNNAKEFKARSQSIELYFKSGGLPGVCFIRNKSLMKKKIDQQLFTLLDRDLRKVVTTQLPYTVLRNLLVELARVQGKKLEYASLRKKTGISLPTLKKLIYGFEAIFLVRQIRVEGGRKGLVVYFEDQGEHQHLLGESDEISLLTHFIFTQFRVPFEVRLDAPVEVFTFSTRGGAQVPLVYKTSEGVLGVIPISKKNDPIKELGSAHSFLRHYPNGKILILHMGTEKRLIEPRILVSPVTEWV